MARQRHDLTLSLVCVMKQILNFFFSILYLESSFPQWWDFWSHPQNNLTVAADERFLNYFLQPIWKGLAHTYCATSPLFACCEVKGSIYGSLSSPRVPLARVLAYGNPLMRSIGVWVVYEGGVEKKGKPNIVLQIVRGFTWGGWVSFLLLSGACILHVFINRYLLMCVVFFCYNLQITSVLSAKGLEGFLLTSILGVRKQNWLMF